MARFDEHDLPVELREVAGRLRAARPSFTQLELDQLKLRAMANSTPDEAPRARRMRRVPMRSRLLTLALATAIIGGTTAGGIAAGGSNASPSSSSSQYCKKINSPPPCKPK